MTSLRRRRLVAAIIILFATLGVLITSPDSYQIVSNSFLKSESEPTSQSPAAKVLDELSVKGRSPKTGYSREQFGDGWENKGSCDMRNLILIRDLEGERIDSECEVLSGQLTDPYSGDTINFKRGQNSSALVQIDHVVALSDAWQKGAQQLEFDKRVKFANDPLNLLAVSGSQNQAKSDGDAATWLPSNKAFRCQYVARQIAVKASYNLWVTNAEKLAMKQVLQRCPSQKLPTA